MKRNVTGASLIEVLVASLFVAFFATSLLQGFKFISQNLIRSGVKIAGTTAIESVEQKLKNKTLIQLPISTSLVAIPGISPTVNYDPTNYPEELVPINGISYRVYTYVEKINTDATGAIVVLQPSDTETRMRRAHITAVTGSGDSMRLTRRSLILNHISRASRPGFRRVDFTGVITSTSGAPIHRACLSVVGADEIAPTYTDTQGRFSYFFDNPSTNPFVFVRAAGYDNLEVFDLNVPANVGQVSRNFSLTKTSFSPVTGSVWRNEKLVISAVAGSVLHPLTSAQEWVEIFNPTTWTWTVSGTVGLRYGNLGSAFPVGITYNTASILPGRYYLFANVSPIVVGASSVNADAVWTPGNPNLTNFSLFATGNNIITVNGDTAVYTGVGALELTGSGGVVLDRLGWAGAEGPVMADGTPIPAVGGIGLETGESFKRFSSTAGVNDAFGPAYDTDDNIFNWASSGAVIPRNSLTAPATIKAGFPADGVWVKVKGDPYSSLVQASTVGTAPYLRAAFTIPQASRRPASVMAIHPKGNGLTPTVIGSGEPVDIFIKETHLYFAAKGRLVHGGAPLPDIFVSGAYFFKDDALSGTVALSDQSSSDSDGNFGVISGPLNSPSPHNYINCNFSYAGGHAFQGTLLVNETYDGKYHSYNTPYPPLAGILQTASDIDLAWNTRLIIKSYTDGTLDPPICGGYSPGSFIVNPYSYSQSNVGQNQSDNTTHVVYVKPGAVTINSSWTPPDCIVDPPLPLTINVPATAYNVDFFGATITYRSNYGEIRGTISDNGVGLGMGGLVAAFSTPPHAPLGAGVYPPSPGSAGVWTTTTRGDGTYSFNQMKPGKYHIYAWRSGIPEIGSVSTDRKEVLSTNLSANGVSTVDFQW